MTRPLLAFGFATALVMADEPAPKLVPRPIPGMPAAKPFETPTDVLMSGFAPPPKPGSQPSAAPASVPPPQPSAPPLAVPVANEPARVLFVHRRDRLPAAMRQRLKVLPVESAAASPRPAAAHEMIDERPAAIRIIPKSEVPLLKPPPAPPNPP